MSHDHSHAHAPADFGRAFIIGIALNIGFVLFEVTFGLIAQSLALLADAGHNLSDILGLALAWGASVLARRAPTKRRTYGLRGTTILAALANAVLLYVAIGAIAWEAIRRFGQLQNVEGETVVWVAALGVVINGITALLFMSGRKSDMNVRGAFLHMVADAGVSLGVVISGVLISGTGWLWLDPVISLAIVLVIGVGTWSLLKESVNLSLGAVPSGVDSPGVERYLAGIPGVVQVHDLHIWGMSTTETALTAHLVMPDAVCDDGMLARISDELLHRFGIHHTTIQLERGDCDFPCEQASDDVV